MKAKPIFCQIVYGNLRVDFIINGYLTFEINLIKRE